MMIEEMTYKELVIYLLIEGFLTVDQAIEIRLTMKEKFISNICKN
jgi:hypothetical protein